MLRVWGLRFFGSDGLRFEGFYLDPRLKKSPGSTV